MSVPTMLTVPRPTLINQGIKLARDVFYQCSPEELVAQTIQRGQGVLNHTGALVIKTGEFTGRSPKDKFIVRDEITRDAVNWNEFNIPFDAVHFNQLQRKMLAYLEQKEVWVDADARLLNINIPSVAAGSYFMILTNKKTGKKYSEKIIVQ